MKQKKKQAVASPGRLNWAMAAVLSALPAMVQAGGSTDGTVGAAQSFSGNFTIPQTLGRISGSNLFHSFQSFSVNAGESATFTTTSPLANVISRVTGGAVSTFNGPLTLSAAPGSAPNFFFINPAGVTFGAGATVDVPAGFHVSTANYLKFGDGKFYADAAQTSTFSAAAPEAFGFLGSTNGTLNVRNGATIAGATAQPISLIGNNVQINNANVSTQGGEIRVAANGTASQEIRTTGLMPYAYGTLSITNGGKIVSSASGSTNGGNINLSAGTTTIDGQGTAEQTGVFSRALAGTTGHAGNIDIASYGALSISNGGSVASFTNADGNAGAIFVDAGTIDIDGNGRATGIFSNANAGSSGNAGEVNLYSVGAVTAASGGQVSSSTLASGAAQTVSVTAGSLSIDGTGSTIDTGVFSNAYAGSSGPAWTVAVNVDGNLSLTNGGKISSSTSGSGDGGIVTVNAENITINGNGQTTGIFIDTRGAGDGWYAEVNARGNLVMTNGGLISASTSGTGYGGQLSVEANNIAIVGGSSGVTGIIAETFGAGHAYPLYTATDDSIIVKANGTLAVTNGAKISSNTYSSGDAGYVNVQAGNLSLTDGGTISSSTFGDGNAGLVKVTAGSATIDGMGGQRETGLISSAEQNSTGYAGSVQVTTTGNLTIQEGGKISSSTAGAGEGGAVVVNAENIAINGKGKTTGIFIDTRGAGNGWYAEVNATGNLTIENGGLISASTSGEGYGGQLRVQANNLTITGGTNGVTGIIAETFGPGHAYPIYTATDESIIVRTTGDLTVTNGAKISSNTYGDGDAGIVKIEAGGNLNITNAGTVSSSTSGGGNAGKVNVIANALTIDGTGRSTGISSGAGASSLGHGGTVDVTVNNGLSIVNGGSISTNTSSVGNSGEIYVNAGSIAIEGQGSNVETGIFSNALSGSTGDAMSVVVTAAGELSITDGGKIASTTFGPGEGGAIVVDAENIFIDGNGKTTGIFIDTRGAGNGWYAEVRATGNLTIENRGLISASTGGAGNAGQLFVEANNVSITGSTGGVTGIIAETFGSGHAAPNNPSPNSGNSEAAIVVKAGSNMLVGNGAKISSNTYAEGNAGIVDIQAGGTLAITNGGKISSSTSDYGDGSLVKVTATNVAINGSGNTTDITGLFSNAEQGSVGYAGSVEVNASGSVLVVNGGTISTSTYGDGDAGFVKVTAGTVTIDGMGNSRTTGLFSSAEPGSTGWAESVQVTASGNLSILEGGKISSSTAGIGEGGAVEVNAENITINGKGKTTGIFIDTRGPGNGWYAEVNATGNLTIENGGLISASTSGEGYGGQLSVQANNLTITGGTSGVTGIIAETFGPGHAYPIYTPTTESIIVRTTGDLSVTDGAKISSNTYSTGDAGIVRIEAGGDLNLTNGGTISSSSFGDGYAGSVSVAANNLTIDGGGDRSLVTGLFSNAERTFSGATTDGYAGSVEVNVTNNLSISKGGKISSSTYGNGDAGSVAITANNVSVDGMGQLTGIFGSSEVGSTGYAGSVELNASGSLSISNGGVISSTALGEGAAGTVDARANAISIDGNGKATGIYSSAGPNSLGGFQRPNVTVVATNEMSIANGGSISSNTYSGAPSGEVTVAAGSLSIDGQGATVDTGIFSNAMPGSAGEAWSVSVSVSGNLSIVDRGQISSSTYGSGDGGAVFVEANNIAINGKGRRTGIFIDTTGPGDGWYAEVAASGNMTIENGGLISASTSGSGWAGQLNVQANNIGIVGGTGVTGIIAETHGQGSALPIHPSPNNGWEGNNQPAILVYAPGTTSVSNGGKISTNTYAGGAAGALAINTGNLLLNSGSTISSEASQNSSGQAGAIGILANNAIALAGRSSISVQNEATVANPETREAGLINISAPSIMINNSAISAASTGNVDASSIEISYTRHMIIDPSSVTTSANEGNGGDISITGTGPLIVDHSQITTSVLSPNGGNGGNISISAPVLALNTGFIQANTATDGASGGEVSISVDSILTSGNNLQVGGTRLSFAQNINRFGVNVIQAANPGGENGEIKLSSPQIDLSSALASLNAQVLDFGDLGADLCRVGTESSLTPTGRGGLPIMSSGWVRPW